MILSARDRAAMIQRIPHHIFLCKNMDAVLAVDQYAKDHQLPGRIIHAPSDLLSECGLAFACPDTEFALWEAILAENELSIEQIVQRPLLQAI